MNRRLISLITVLGLVVGGTAWASGLGQRWMTAQGTYAGALDYVTHCGRSQQP